jgi:hypothetical protein
MSARAKVCQAADDTMRAAAQWNGRELAVPASCGNAREQKIATPIAGFRVQPP